MSNLQNIIMLFAADEKKNNLTKVNKITAGNAGEANLNKAVVNIINGVVGALGIICVVVVIIGGINYMTSAGDPAKTKKAKDTILYGIIGMIICALAFAIVNFVIVNIINTAA